MRWYPTPDGTLRLRKAFAFIPETMDNGEVVWLESFKRQERRVKYGPRWSIISQWTDH